jgi:hypothetical protein
MPQPVVGGQGRQQSELVSHPGERFNAGMTVLDPETNQLPRPPDVELALYRRSGLRNDQVIDVLERLLWKSVA